MLLSLVKGNPRVEATKCWTSLHHFRGVSSVTPIADDVRNIQSGPHNFAARSDPILDLKRHGIRVKKHGNVRFSGQLWQLPTKLAMRTSSSRTPVSHKEVRSVGGRTNLDFTIA